jgi:hypothetical protein
MRRRWDELVIDFFDRMDGVVAAAHKGRLDDEEHELAVAVSRARFSKNLITTFDGISIGQLVNACKTLARGICIDVQRLGDRLGGGERLRAQRWRVAPSGARSRCASRRALRGGVWRVGADRQARKRRLRPSATGPVGDRSGDFGGFCAYAGVEVLAE